MVGAGAGSIAATALCAGCDGGAVSLLEGDTGALAAQAESAAAKATKPPRRHPVIKERVMRENPFAIVFIRMIYKNPLCSYIG